MIVKIVHHEAMGSECIQVPGGEQTPHQVVLLDDVDEVEFEKVACHNAGELRKLATEFGYGDRWYGQPLPESNEEEDQSGGRETLLMRFTRKGVERSIVAISAAVFFMNESGKTVDKVVCR